MIGTATYLRMFLRPRERFRFAFWQNRRWDGELVRRMLKYGLPNGLQSLGDAAAFTLFLFLVGSMDRTALAATNLSFNINMLIFIPMLGVGTAVTVLVGRHIGEGRPDLAARSTWMAMLATGSVTLLFCTAFLTLPHVLLEPFRRYASPDEFGEVEPLVLGLLKFVAVYSVFDAMFIVFGSAVKSAGDTRIALLVNMLSAWCLMVSPVALMQITGTLTLTRCWICCSAHIMTCGTVFFLRFLYGPWRSMKVIESPLEGETNVPESPNSQIGSDSGKIDTVLRTAETDDPHRDELDSQATKTVS
jgi:MATE family multidrug resistance protein